MILHWTLVGTLSHFASLQLAAQALVEGGGDFPKESKEYLWYLDTVHDYAYAQTEGKWTFITSNVKKLTPLGDCFVDAHFHQGDVGMIYCKKGISLGFSNEVEVVDRIVIKRRPAGSIIYGEHGDRISLFHNSIVPSLDLIELGDEKGYCIPWVVNEMYSYPSSTWYTWGILGTSGHWIIEPVFDKPFQFHEGTAKVSYYGQERTINALGSFID